MSTHEAGPAHGARPAPEAGPAHGAVRASRNRAHRPGGARRRNTAPRRGAGGRDAVGPQAAGHHRGGDGTVPAARLPRHEHGPGHRGRGCLQADRVQVLHRQGAAAHRDRARDAEPRRSVRARVRLPRPTTDLAADLRALAQYTTAVTRPSVLQLRRLVIGASHRLPSLARAYYQRARADHGRAGRLLQPANGPWPAPVPRRARGRGPFRLPGPGPGAGQEPVLRRPAVFPQLITAQADAGAAAFPLAAYGIGSIRADATVSQSAS